MSRPKDSQKKVEVSRPAEPLQHNPFAMLGEVEVLKNLAPARAPEPEPDRPPRPGSPLMAGSQGSKPATTKLPKPTIPPNSRGRLILRRETKERGGKVVVVIHGFTELPGANAVMIGNLAKELKGKLGCGGSFDRHEIVLQGDRCAAVCALLEELGFRVDGVKS